MAGNFMQFLRANKQKTFRPKKKFAPGTIRYSLHKQAQETLNAGLDLRHAVRCPVNEDKTDWIAVHVVDFFNRINLIYGIIADWCTKETCPRMTGGSKYEYLWQDGKQFKKPTFLPAPEYISLLMDWVEGKINDASCFPVDISKEKRIYGGRGSWERLDQVLDQPFPRNFDALSRKILTRLYRVFVHVYIHHFERLALIDAEAHVNTCYKHFYYFVTEFGLIDAREMEPLVRI